MKNPKTLVGICNNEQNAQTLCILVFPIKATHFKPKTKKPYIKKVLLSVKQTINRGGCSCFVSLYILSMASSVKIHLFRQLVCTKSCGHPGS